ncbi:hypothetical protein ABGB12_28300 [Actinocorallia sp. B10E7]|uniref:hypothetical protein n=1 Tax=Actinocorallia sp. B10E7 TaxID=3153558 RepID=UPI00325E1D99
MQALSLAIGPAGINYFAQRLVVQQMAKTLAGVQPPNRTIPIPNFSSLGFGYSDSYSKISIVLSNGTLSGFNPGYRQVTQKGGGQFDLTLLAQTFTAKYGWHETYDDYSCITSGEFPSCQRYSNQQKNFPYAPGFGSLTTVVTLGFQYDKTNNTYDIVVVGTPAVTTGGTSANIPGGSIIQNEDAGCFTSHVSDATAASVASIDFATPISTIFTPLIKSIAASGHLTDDITYDFAIGDSGLYFPGDRGLAIGITGSVTYKGAPYPGTPPVGLPVPPPPTDAHHLQLYVSNYELDALYWAFCQDGRLAVTVHASDLPDPEVLHCKTYVSLIKAFKPYAAFAMRADVVPRQAPKVAFQKVWVLTETVMETLKNQLPSTVYTLLDGLEGNAYAAQAAFEQDLQDATIDRQYWQAIERAAYASGMVMTEDLQFTLTILNGATSQPDIVFDLVRTDILQNLGLGVHQGSGSPSQTLTFDFVHADYKATFVSSTVPNFDGAGFGEQIWPIAGEPSYDKELAAIGRIGSPLPIMSGFQFLFEDAELSIQEGFVSILAKMTYT